MLEADGRSIKPCLIHGEIWEGNIETLKETGDMYRFDSGAYYAHNEMEIAGWRCSYNRISDLIYTETYFEMLPGRTSCLKAGTIEVNRTMFTTISRMP